MFIPQNIPTTAAFSIGGILLAQSNELNVQFALGISTIWRAESNGQIVKKYSN